MTHQIPLDLALPDQFSVSDFVVSEANQGLYGLLMTPNVWLNPHTILIGPPQSGKTHAGRVFAETHAALWLSPDTDTTDLNPTTYHHIVIDDADSFDQEALFHLFNQTTAQDGRLLLLSQRHPQQWPIRIADIESRLKAMRVVDMPEPDDVLLRQVLKKLFEHRLITPSEEALDYISRRMARSFNHAQKIVTGIEDYANGRAFTRALAREFIDKYENLSWLSESDEI